MEFESLEAPSIENGLKAFPDRKTILTKHRIFLERLSFLPVNEIAIIGILFAVARRDLLRMWIDKFGFVTIFFVGSCMLYTFHQWAMIHFHHTDNDLELSTPELFFFSGRILFSLLLVFLATFLNQNIDILLLVFSEENINASRHILLVCILHLVFVAMSTRIQFYHFMQIPLVRTGLDSESEDKKHAEEVYKMQLKVVILSGLNSLSLAILAFSLSIDKSNGGDIRPTLNIVPVAVFLNLVFIGSKVIPYHFSCLMYLPFYFLAAVALLYLIRVVLLF
jgi:hypothetical protein